MNKSFTTLLAVAFLMFAITACSRSEGATSRHIETPTTQPSMAAAPTVNVDLSVEAAYEAIPHNRTVMDFAASNMPESDKRFLEVAFHVIDQAIRVRVSAYRKFSRGELSDVTIADFDLLIEYLQKLEAPDSLTSYQARLVEALSDQRDFFQDWLKQAEPGQYGKSVASHAKVQSASAALKGAYGMLIELYPNEAPNNKQAFFDYHCALDFI
jgi:hypothetical protein